MITEIISKTANEYHGQKKERIFEFLRKRLINKNIFSPLF